MIKIKICGITNHDDASLAVRLGADALGFIFAPSPRRIDPENARDIIRHIPPFVKAVGVFVDEDQKSIDEIITFCGIDMVQLHGDEPPEICDRFMPRTIKALRIADESAIRSAVAYKEKVKALLLDSYSDKMSGGSGKSFDWDIAISIRDSAGIPIILAGGIGPSNIEEAISRVRPYAVDVNSGVEERPGKKSRRLMEELFEKINNIKRQEPESKIRIQVIGDR
jgi:phosphoribosylanthranilate isomerase